MEIKLSKDDIEAIATSVAIKLEKDINQRPIVYSVSDVAEILKCHKNTVLNHIKNKIIDAKLNGKSYGITQESLNKYLSHDKV